MYAARARACWQRAGAAVAFETPNRPRPCMNLYFLLGLICLVLWLVLAFGLAIPAGWVHVPLAAAAVLIAVGIVKADAARDA